MSALRTPTLPRRDTPRAHPQPRAALLRQAEGGVTFIIQSQPVSSAPLTSWGTAAHTDGFQTDGTHSNSQSHISHTHQSDTDKTVNKRLLLPPQTQSRTATVFRSGQTATRAIKHAIITFEHSNHPIIHSFIHSSFNQSSFNHSSFNHSFQYTHHNHSSIHHSIRDNGRAG